MIEGDIATRTESIAASSASMRRTELMEKAPGEPSAARIDEFKRRIEALEHEIEAIRHKLLAMGEVSNPLVS